MGYPFDQESVELRPAFVWMCPECGKEFFEKGIVIEFPEGSDYDPEDEPGWLEGPEVVHCPDCDREFDTVGFNESQDDVEEGLEHNEDD